MREKIYISSRFHALTVHLNSSGKTGKFDEVKSKLRPIQFSNFRYKLDLDKEEDQEIDEALKVHSGNVSKGGKMFREQSIEEEAIISKTEKGNFAKLPEGGLTEEVCEAVGFLSKVSDNHKGVAKAGILKALETVRESLNVVGLPKYNERSSAKTLGAAATILLNILLENKIEIEDEREADSGAGAKTDQG